jgi:uncharacterized protein YbjT (DUF2867 family)
MKVILTGATGMVGEGVLLACLEDPAVERVLAVARRSCGHTHDKLEEIQVADFRDLGEATSRLAGFDACFYCAGVSSVGMSEADYTTITHDTALAFAKSVLALNPSMVLTHISGAQTDGTEKGRLMWARVKGRTENDLMKLPFKGVYNFRPGLMKPMPGQVHVKTGLKIISALYPVINVFLPGLTLNEVGRAMIQCVEAGAPKQVLEVADIRALAALHP